MGKLLNGYFSIYVNIQISWGNYVFTLNAVLIAQIRSPRYTHGWSRENLLVSIY